MKIFRPAYAARPAYAHPSHLGTWMVGDTKLVGRNWCFNPVNTGLRHVHTKHPSSAKSCFSAFHNGIPIGNIGVRIEPANTKNTQVKRLLTCPDTFKYQPTF
jgi:hypothetical protein